MSITRNLSGLTALVFGLSLMGCRDAVSNQVAAKNQSNIQRLSNLYAGHQNMMNGKGPKDEAAFKAWLEKYDPAKLTMMGIDQAKLDDLFKSERDGQPFKFRFNVGGGRGSVAAVVFEQAGKDGKRQVGYTGGEVKEVDEAMYKDLLAGKSANVAPPSAGPATNNPATAGGRPSGAPAGATKGPHGK
ncbi:hypothetical protein BH10PLA2_BH10PLA2_23050 [soil metagenome]